MNAEDVLRQIMEDWKAFKNNDDLEALKLRMDSNMIAAQAALVREVV
jgi:hypothetical protein